MRGLAVDEPLPFGLTYPQANPLAIDLLSQLLMFNPARRLSARAALEHPYLAKLADANPQCRTELDTLPTVSVADIDETLSAGLLPRELHSETVAFLRREGEMLSAELDAAPPDGKPPLKSEVDALSAGS